MEMAQDLERCIVLSEKDIKTEEPQLRLHLKADPRLSVTLPYTIEFKIERLCQDDDEKPILLKWSPLSQLFGPSGFILLHHTPSGLKPVDIDHSGLAKIAEDKPPVIVGWGSHVEQLDPGFSHSVLQTLPARYHKILQSGERYILLWPGGEIAEWDWGEGWERTGQELNGPSTSGVRLIVPGGPHISFTAESETEPWPARAEKEAQLGFSSANMAEQQRREARKVHRWVEPSQRHLEAPHLRVHLECSPTLTLNTCFGMTIKVTYDAEETARPITFHKPRLAKHDYFRLYRRHGDDWEECGFQCDGDMGFLIADEPDVEINVGQNDSFFVSLRPGETWSNTIGLDWYGGTELPDDVRKGDRFCCEYTGETLDWWNWGSKSEHLETIVKLPCYLYDSVVEPRDNDGRPELTVPTSEAVKFTVVD